MIRPRSATLTLVLLALASGCSAKSSAPGPAHGAADAKSVPLEQGIAPADERAAAEASNASPAPPPPPAEEERAEPAGGRAVAMDDALAGSRVQIAEPMVNGGLGRDIIRRKAMDHQADLQACHARAPELAGKIAVKLSVDARGLVKDVELSEQSELDDRELVDCILGLELRR